MTKYTSKDISSLSSLASKGFITFDQFQEDDTVLNIADCLANSTLDKKFKTAETLEIIWNNARPSIGVFFINDQANPCLKVGSSEVELDIQYLAIRFDEGKDGRTYCKIEMTPFDTVAKDVTIELYATAKLGNRIPQQFVSQFGKGLLTSADFEEPALISVPSGTYDVKEVVTVGEGRTAHATIALTEAPNTLYKVRVAPTTLEVGDKVSSEGFRLRAFNRFGRPMPNAINPGIGADLTEISTLLKDGVIYYFDNPIQRSETSVSIDVNLKGYLGTIWKPDRLQLFGESSYARVTIKTSKIAASGFTYLFELVSQEDYNLTLTESETKKEEKIAF